MDTISPNDRIPFYSLPIFKSDGSFFGINGSNGRLEIRLHASREGFRLHALVEATSIINPLVVVQR